MSFLSILKPDSTEDDGLYGTSCTLNHTSLPAGVVRK
ncbi:unnamed protein product [Larinioides sclopetarius]|uniref:Uncharacterized protein n=1 Tax=Larinioides sclopetarius TaxID=280406 RepID=A0AAV1ZVZ6_9ARAC